MSDATQFNTNAPLDGDGFFCQSVYGVFERKPFVQIALRHEGEVRTIQISPDNARAFALNLLEVAAAAEMDALLVKFLQEKLHVELEPAALILMDFRSLREEGNT